MVNIENDMIKVKGYEFKRFNTKLSSYRRAVQIQNSIIKLFRKIGVPDEDIEIPLQKLVIRTAEASIEWWQEGYRLFYKYNLAGSFISNLHVIFKLLELQIAEVEKGDLTLDDFLRGFSEDDDVSEQRLAARKLLGVDEDCMDFTLISKKYKVLAMKYHPDRPDGSLEMFKKINNAHKMLKRELE